MKKIWIFIAFCLPLSAYGQPFSAMPLMFQLPIPAGDYQQNGNEFVGAGIRFNFLVRPKPTSLVKFGIDLGVFQSAKSEETIPLNIAGFQDEYEVTAVNSVGNFGLLFQVDPWWKKVVSPYLELAGGARSFLSNAYFNRKDDGGSIDFGKRGDTKTHWGAYVGAGVGLRIAPGKRSVFAFHLKCDFMKGTKTIYNAKPRFDSQNAVVFDRRNTTTDLIIPQIGLEINFGRFADVRRTPGQTTY